MNLKMTRGVLLLSVVACLDCRPLSLLILHRTYTVSLLPTSCNLNPTSLYLTLQYFTLGRLVVFFCRALLAGKLAETGVMVYPGVVRSHFLLCFSFNFPRFDDTKM
jgi:hypothetical protein